MSHLKCALAGLKQNLSVDLRSKNRMAVIRRE
jgi:hypothetical protein